MGTGHDLDCRRDAIALDPGHDTEELIPCRLGDDRPVDAARRRLGEQPTDLADRHQSLAASAAFERQAAFLAPATEGLDPDAEQLAAWPIRRVRSPLPETTVLHL